MVWGESMTTRVASRVPKVVGSGFPVVAPGTVTTMRAMASFITLAPPSSISSSGRERLKTIQSPYRAAKSRPGSLYLAHPAGATKRAL